MTDPPEYQPQSKATAQLNKWAKDISLFAYNATEEQKEALLRLLNDGQISELLEAWQHKDSRGSPRKPCLLTVQFGIEEQMVTEIIRNASADGVFIESFAPLRVGQEITMTIWTTDREETVEITGEVVWAGSKGVGVRFTTPGGEVFGRVVESV